MEGLGASERLSLDKLGSNREHRRCNVYIAFLPFWSFVLMFRTGPKKRKVPEEADKPIRNGLYFVFNEMTEPILFLLIDMSGSTDPLLLLKSRIAFRSRRHDENF